MRLLIERDVDIDAKDNWGNTALSSAVAGGYQTIVQLLNDKRDVRASG